MSKIIIIGGGPGGYKAAEYAAQKGLEVILVEGNHIGGTCLNVGCIPTKTLCRNAEIMQHIKEAETFGIHLDREQVSIDYPSMVQRKDDVIQKLRQGIDEFMLKSGVKVIKGLASFVDNRTIKVGEEQYTADKIIIATGSIPKIPPIPGVDLPGVMDSSDLLALTQLPKSLCVIGAGVIGLEFASIFVTLGCEVTVVEMLKECVPAIDADIAKRLRKSLEKKGVVFHMQTATKAINKQGNMLSLTLDKKGKELELSFEKVLVATGRKPQIEHLGLQNTSIAHTPVGITVDQNLQTTQPDVYAIGDVNGKTLLAHAATFQGFKVINHILGSDDKINLDNVPSAIFTMPEAASVGLSEQACKDQSIAYTCHKGYYHSNGKAIGMNETEGLIKIISDDSRRIIGAHILGAHASSMVQLISVCIDRAMTMDDIKDSIFTHPTIEEIISDIAWQSH